jgi:glycosyltransferase involved in cell wall biosynthesis
MRILHVCPGHAYSGLESWVIEMIRFQRESGLDSRLVALKGAPLSEIASKAGIPVIHVEAPVSLSVLGSAVSRAVSEFDPGILHLHGSREFKLLIPWIARRKIIERRPLRVILQLHIWISHSKRDPLHALSYRLIDEIWCSSEPAKASIVDKLPVPERKIRILKYGRDIVKMEAGFFERAEARRALNLPEDATIVGTVARIDRGKGTAELVDGTLPHMERDEKLHLMLIGSPTDDPEAVAFAENLVAKIRRLPEPLGSRVHLPGNVKDSYRLLKAFDIFALPTHRECFSLALIEAQLAGLPCLVTNSGGSPELVKEGKTGWLCEPDRTPSFEAALGRALSEVSSWQGYGLAAQARIRAEFDSRLVLGEMVATYRVLVEP